ncbi:MAG: AbrB/MazE/SpoVT family DNA-binding domain-containing protein [Gammaproteobacteria bacterium]|jgi:antitoxin MazE|nr:AbrB/MazE/SpoVT family DNA-binding domain-containing protein [Xanthomonadales bacterium]
MLTKIQKWGNSQGIRIPKIILESSLIELGEEVDISIENGRIVLTPTKRIHGRFAIADLVAEMPKEYNISEEDWGESEGKEEW